MTYMVRSLPSVYGPISKLIRGQTSVLRDLGPTRFLSPQFGISLEKFSRRQLRVSHRLCRADDRASVSASVATLMVTLGFIAQATDLAFDNADAQESERKTPHVQPE